VVRKTWDYKAGNRYRDRLERVGIVKSDRDRREYTWRTDYRLFVNVIISRLIEFVLQHSYILICNSNSYICRHIKNEIEEYNQKMKQLRNIQTSDKLIYNTIEGIMIILTVLIGGSIGRNIAVSRMTRSLNTSNLKLFYEYFQIYLKLFYEHLHYNEFI